MTVGYYNQTDKVDEYANKGQITLSLLAALSFPLGNSTIAINANKNYLRRQTGLFGKTTINLGDFGLDDVHFTAGYRRSHVKQALTIIPSTVDPVRGIVPTGAALITPPPLSQSANSYTFALDWKIAPKVLVYGTTRHGFKAGDINLSQIVFAGDPRVPESILFFNPEKVADYEVGVKADWQVGSIAGRSNVAIYTADFTISRETRPIRMCC